MFRQKFQDMPLKHKIQLVLLSCVFFISFISFINIYYISRAYGKVLYRSLSSNLSYSATEISECLKQTENLADMILSNSIIQEQLPIREDTASRAERQLCEKHIYDTLCNYLFNTADSHISYISILQDDSSISTYSPAIRNMSADIKRDLIDIGKSMEGATTWVTDYSREYGLFLVKELREARKLSFRSLGVLVINIDLDDLISQTTAFHSDYESVSYLLACDDGQLYSTENLSENSISDLENHLHRGYAIFSMNGESVFAVRGEIHNYNWDYICMVSYESIAYTISVTMKLCILSMIVSIILTLFSSSRILGALTKHFNRLIYKMNLFGDGNYTLSDEVRQPRGGMNYGMPSGYTLAEDTYNYKSRKDEIGLLHTNFDSMVQKVNTLIKENYINELLKKEAQLHALESQMDPHFLYNTLDSINWRAKAIKADDISQVTTALGNLLRISLSKNNHPFSIRQEITILDNYMTIQKLRYPHKLEYSIDIPEKFRDCEIPKFTIQPLLENAIRYGLEEISEICYISVSSFTSGSDLIIEVKNNGSYFDEDLLEKLETQQIQPHGFGIGILNIHKRLNIMYGSSYGLRLYNMINEEDGEEYAVAHLSLPLRSLTKGES